MNFSEEQRAAIECMDKQVLVAAAAGSGKTRVIVEHIKYLLDHGADPEKIYAITYTNMAAQEMLERLDAPVFIGTIHSLANRILLINGINTSSWIEEQCFDKLLDRINNDFDEDITNMPEIEHLLVDEFQDVCDDEASFIRYSLNAKHLFVVGDSCQSIYSFKGGNYENFMKLVRSKNTTLLKLSMNYRNGTKILSRANRFIEDMHDVYRIKNIPYTKEPGTLIEEEYSLGNIYNYLKHEVNYGDWFILGRTNAQVDEILGFLQGKKIPCSTFKKSEKSYAELKEEFKNNSVKVLTIHSAKGLEAKNVIVVGMKQFNAEEKRVCYVACTRAKELLVIMNEPRRGRRAEMSMYDTAGGRVIDFTSMNNEAYNKGNWTIDTLKEWYNKTRPGRYLHTSTLAYIDMLMANVKDEEDLYNNWIQVNRIESDYIQDDCEGCSYQAKLEIKR